MAKIKGTTGVVATISPASDTAKYPATSEVWHKGGFKGFATIAERDAMLENYKKDFMLCYVDETKLFYILVGGVWQEVAFGSSQAQDGQFNVLHDASADSLTITL